MNVHRLLALSAASSALALAIPASAQPDLPYEYTNEAGAEVEYRGDMVAPVPGPPPATTVVAAPFHGDPMGAPAMYPYAPHTLPPHAYAPAPHPTGYRPGPPFDRGAWLANCRERIRGVSRQERDGVIGGLLGAGVGGVIGNRAWDSERLAGTLLGAGVGGLAGVAIGSAIGAAGDRRRDDECAWQLDRYMVGSHAAGGYSHSGYAPGYHGYGYGHPVIAYVPVLVAIPQRAVVRETVTEEWGDAPARHHTQPYRRAPRVHAPAADKRIKYTKVR